MENYGLNMKSILDIIFKTTKKKGNILADMYLIKDPSIISKWKNSKCIPTNEDISAIIDFVYKESSEMQRKIIRNQIEILIINSLIEEKIKKYMLDICEFKEFLSEVLNMVTSSVKNHIQYKVEESIQLNDSKNKYNNAVVEDYSKSIETVTAFSDGIEGSYVGEFKLRLSRDISDNYESTAGYKDISFAGNCNVVKENKKVPINRKLRTTGIIGTFAIVALTSLF